MKSFQCPSSDEMTKIAYTGEPQLASISLFTHVCFLLSQQKKSLNLFCPKFHLTNSKSFEKNLTP
jgi:hypothetical protein